MTDFPFDSDHAFAEDGEFDFCRRCALPKYAHPAVEGEDQP